MLSIEGRTGGPILIADDGPDSYAAGVFLLGFLLRDSTCGVKLRLPY